MIARNSSFSYKDKHVPVKTIARELGVKYVLQGSVRRAGDRLRINAQLVDAQTQGQIWAERYDGTVNDVFALQDQVTDQVTNALAVTIAPEVRARIRRKPTANIEAYEIFLKAEEKRRHITSDSIRDALALYQQAIDLDPEYAEAYAGDAWAAYYVLRTGLRVLKPKDAAARVERSLARALALAPDLGMAHAVQGMLATLKGEHTRAVQSTSHAVKVAPTDAVMRLAHSHALNYAGKREASVKEAELSLRLDPNPEPFQIIQLAWHFYFGGEYQRVCMDSSSFASITFDR